MSDKTTPVSFRKSGSSDGSASPGRPRTVVYAAAALVLTGVAAMSAVLSLYGLKSSWLLPSSLKVNAKLAKGKRLAVDKIPGQVDTVVSTQTVATAVLLLAMLIMAFSVYRGRYWARWGVLALWVLSTFTGSLASVLYALSITTSEPVAFKVPTFIAAVSFVAAVVLVNLRPSINYFNLTKPERGAARPGRTGMFAPRPAAAPSRPGRISAPAASSGASPAQSGPDRSRSKRANAEAVAKGAELARTRAKASKSRRTGA